METLLEKITTARRVGVPLMMIETTDQPALLKAATAAILEKKAETAVVLWDHSRGLQPVNDAGGKALSHLGMSDQDLREATPTPEMAMREALKFPKDTVLFAYNLHRHWNQPQVAQAVANLRDPFKGSRRTLIVLTDGGDVPGEFRHDVVSLDDPLPSDEQYGQIVQQLHEYVKLETPKPVEPITSSVRGLSAFEAEQIISMSLKKSGLDLDECWEHKRHAVKKTKGLTLTYNDGPDLANLRGLGNAVDTLQRYCSGPLAPHLFLRIDEMDKALAGLGQDGGAGDNTGISQDLLQQFLIAMEDNGWVGFIFAGVRGGGKTVLSRAIAKAAKVPEIAMDPGAMKGSLVGQSEQSFRDAFRMIKSIGRSRVCVLVTCNRMDVFPPELLRRFKFGTFFFDLPTASELADLWAIYTKQFGLKKQATPNDVGWTGSEVRNCCEIAHALQCSLLDASNRIVPICKSNPASIEKMRIQANGASISASYPGVYLKDKAKQLPKLSLTEERTLEVE